MLAQRGFLFVIHLSMSNLMGGFKCAGTVKIRGFDTISRCRPREGGYRVSYGTTLKTVREKTLIRGLHTALSLETNGEKEYRILKFWTYYGTTKFT